MNPFAYLALVVVLGGPVVLPERTVLPVSSAGVSNMVSNMKIKYVKVGNEDRVEVRSNGIVFQSAVLRFTDRGSMVEVRAEPNGKLRFGAPRK